MWHSSGPGNCRDSIPKPAANAVAVGPEFNSTGWGMVRFKPEEFPSNLRVKLDKKLAGRISRSLAKHETVQVVVVMAGVLIPSESVIYDFSHDQEGVGLIMPVVRVEQVEIAGPAKVHAGCSKSPLSKDAASMNGRRRHSHPPTPAATASLLRADYVEDAIEARTRMGKGASRRARLGRVRSSDFFSFLLIRVFCATKAGATGTAVHRAPIPIGSAQARSRFEP